MVLLLSAPRDYTVHTAGRAIREASRFGSNAPVRCRTWAGAMTWAPPAAISATFT